MVHAQNILLLWDDDDNTVVNRPPLPTELNANTQSLIAGFENAGISVSLSNRTQGLYSSNAPSPNGFDVVVHLNGNSDVFDVMPASSVVNLLNYIQNLGGGFVTSENIQLQLDLPLGLGLSQAANDLSLITRSGGRPVQDFSISKIPAQAGHPLLQGLPNSFGFSSTRLTGGTIKTFNNDPALALMTDDLDSVALAVREFGQGRIVSMHHGGNFSGATALQDPNLQQLYINAVRWADQKAPELVSITRLNSASVGGSGVRYRVLFNEGVTGVNSSDFSATLGGSLSFNNNFVVSAVSPVEYEVQAAGLSGTGTFSLNLLNDGTIRDRSFNQNPLVAGGTGPSYTVDAELPRLLAIIKPQPILGLGTQPTLSFIFSEPMNLGLSPTIFLETEANGIITLTAEDGLGPAAATRVQNDLLALYTFQEGSGNTVRDQSQVAPLLNLEIQNPGATTWLSGGLRLDTPTIIRSAGAAAKLNSALPAANALTIEAWVRPANLSQTGPARLATVSVTTGSRNMTLGQDTSRYEMRLRRTTTDTNAIPLLATSTGTAQTGLQHVAYTWDGATGVGRLYVDGAERVSDSLGGDMSNWDDSFAFALGDEFTENRPWLGEMYLVAIYSRALSSAEILQNRGAGPITDPLGDGRWINPITWQGSIDRPIVSADRGLAVAMVSDGADLANNVMAPDSSLTVSIISSSLTLVQSPPPYQFVEVGSRVQFQVQVSGAAGALNYEWSRDTGNGVYTPVGFNSAFLTLNEVDFSDAGLYRCTISDVQAVVQTPPAQLVVVAQLAASSLLWLILAALGLAWLGRYLMRPGKVES